MIRKGTWIVLVVFALLLAAAFYLNRNPLPSPADLTPTATEVPVLLPGWKDSDVVWIEYRGAPEALTISQNPDGSWTLAGDSAVPAGIGQVEALRTQITALRVISTLNTTDPLDAVGLAAPERVLTLRSGEGQQVEIRIGKETPTGSGYYVQVDGGQPVVISKPSLDSVLEVLTRERLAAPTATPAGSNQLLETPSPEKTGTPQS